MSSGAVFGQVGINTTTPEGILHIDAAKNNNNTATTPITIADDVVVQSSTGNLGLGTKSPAVKLDIETGGTLATPVTGFKLADGNQINNYVLTSDNTGVGTWKPIALTLIPGTLGAGVDIPSAQTGIYYNTGTYIDLPPGKWMITCIMLMSKRNSITGTGSETTAPNESWWVRTTFGDANTPTSLSPTSPDIQGTSKLISGVLVPASYYALINSSIIVLNTSGATKRYYYYAGGISASTVNATSSLRDFGGTVYAEDVIYAQVVN
ncbi:hypothetical protein [Chryseobacterium sp.]|uniref:hypothetical protein n=1 Tax=Chryseobacterium sp. TaxID=1871047 RepID=UPI00284B9A3E|nr:hypothetical protein [Chryseobacterium sp.]MDR3023079.1 hypothetical protein [Chryseobacterium sp.]